MVAKLVENQVTISSDFEWISQLRYYWENNTVAVKMITTTVDYAYEYLGNSGRLVITPLTDRCYRSVLPCAAVLAPVFLYVLNRDYKILNGLALGYLSDLISAYRPIRANLCSAHKNLLVVPTTKIFKLKTFCDRCFSFVSSVLWRREFSLN